MKWGGSTSGTQRALFGVMEMFYVLTWVVTRVYAFVKTSTVDS